MGRKSIPVTPMPISEFPTLKEKPSHIELPEIPKSKSKKDLLLEEMQDLLKELENLEDDE